MKPITWITVSMLVVVTTRGGENYSSFNDCSYATYEGKLYAHCEGLGLNSTPRFSNEVIGVNFANNTFEHVPANLPSYILYLNMSHNYLQKLDNTSLAGYSELRNFSISCNKLHEVQAGTFAKNAKLQHLDVSNNQVLTINAIYNISRDLKNSAIKILNTEKLQCTYGVSHIIKIYHVAHLKDTQLEELNLASNRIHSLETGALTSLPKSLRVLNLSDNILSFGFYIMEFAVLQNLEILNISFQLQFHQAIMNIEFFENCNDTLNPSRMADPDHKNDDHSKIKTYWNELISEPHRFNSSLQGLAGNIENFTIYFPPNAREIYFHDNLYKFSVPKLPIGMNNKLSHLFVQRNIIYELRGPITGLGNVEYIDFSGNFCGYLARDIFKDFPKLKHFNLSNNALGASFEADENGQIFSHQTLLSSLDLSFNRIGRLPEKVFQHNTHIAYLNISYNSVNSFNVRIDHLKNLYLLDISYNQLSSLGPSTREALNLVSRTHTVRVNLMGNNLKCSCEHFDFLKWMRNSKTLQFVNFENYTCAFGNSSDFSLKNIDDLLQILGKQCSSYALIIVIITSLIIIVLTLTVSRIVYRYRWKLRYMYYIAREKYQGNADKYALVKETSHRFDAFISYADEDRSVVLSLAKVLEKDYGLKFCLHERDFIPGTGIAVNITNAIHSSRRTVCCMTSRYIESYWCMFELNMARMEAIYSRNGKNILFLIALEKNTMKQMPFHLMDLIETKSYLEYPNCDDERIAFQSKLGDFLRTCDGE
ncbi:toll-like receptor 4 isoform X2 [Ostrea edulis]|nr:toll-like receptor 4 isoform X2 [Ostrea edulis]